MAFDAGSIIARLELDDSDFDRRLRADVAKIEDFEKRSHEAKISVEMDESGMHRARQQFERFDRQVTQDAQRRSRSGAGSILGVLAGMFGGSGGSAAGGGGAAAGGGGGFLRGLAGGAGPGILGIGARGAGIIGAGGAALGALPALAGVGGAGAIAGIGASVIGMGASQLIGTKNKPGQAATEGPLFQQAQALGKTLKDTMKTAAEGMLGPLRQAFTEIPGILHSLAPALHGLFAGAGTMIMPLLHGITDIARVALPLLGQAFRAVAPLVRPLLDGIAGLLKGLLPGLITLLHAAHPAITAFAQVLGILGRDLGGMLKAMAPAISASSVILKALGGVLGALFPIIGRLAAIFAKTLAPVFNDLARVIQSLMPTLVIVGRVFASLAGAVLTDLVAAFGALAKLLVLISPSFKILAQALSSVFTSLENSGVFGVLANALEQMVPSLAKLINSLVRGIVPVLPVVIRLFARLVSLLAAGTARALGDIATALADIIDAIPPKMLQVIVLGVLALVAAFKAMAIINVILAALSANPIILIAAACALLVIGIVELVKHWKAVWGEVKRISADAWHFIYDGFGKYLLPLLGPVGLIALGAIELARHWSSVCGAIKDAARNLWQWLWNDFGAKILGFFTKTIPRWWDATVNLTHDHLIVPWRNGLDNLRQWVWDDFGAKILGFFTKTIPGWWDRFTNLTDNRLIAPFRQGLHDLWHWVWTDFGAKIINFFTNTLPSKFGAGVKAIGSAWNDLKKTITAPVKFVIDNVINGLISAFDWVGSRVGMGSQPIKPVHPFGLQSGGRIPGYGGGDRHLIAAEGGEAVVSKETTARHARELAMWGVPGFQRGGKVGQHAPHPHGNPHLPHGQADPGGGIGPVFHKIGDIGKAVTAVFTGNTTALVNAMTDMIPGGVGGAGADLARLLLDIPKTLLKDAVARLMEFGGGLGAKGPEIVKYAMSFLGKIPYVWGGTSVPGGADCSGFVQAIYRHFGINAPRTSEDQGGWVKRGPPVPGGLAFYRSQAGGPDPGHVAIVRNAMSVISQGGGMGPTLMGLHGMPLLWTGTPPGGVGGVTPGPGETGYITALLADLHAPASRANIMSMATWGRREFPSWPPSARWNLMASTQRLGASTTFNSVGVQNYPDARTGAEANAMTLANGLYPHIVAALRSGAGLIGNGSIAGELSRWSGGGYSSLDSGGWLMPGGVNGTGQPEAVLTPPQSAAYVRMAEAAEAATRGGGGAGSMMRDLNLALSLPEGTTVAQALRELSWALRVARQQSFTG